MWLLPREKSSVSTATAQRDDLAVHEPRAAEQQRQRADLADAAADVAEEHRAERNGGEAARVQGRQRRGIGRRVHAGGEGGRLPAGHQNGVGGEQERAPGQRRIEKVLADAAEKLLDENDGEQRADDGQPPRSRGRHRERQQKAGDNGGKIADGVVFLQKTAVAPFKDHAADDAHHGHEQRAEAEEDHARNQRRHQRDDHVEHDRAGVARRADMGGGGYNEADVFVHLTCPPFLLFPEPWLPPRPGRRLLLRPLPSAPRHRPGSWPCRF